MNGIDYTPIAGATNAGLATTQNQTTYYAEEIINGCPSLIRFPVLVKINECDVTVYNFVSVDNDSLNEIFMIDGITFYPENNVQALQNVSFTIEPGQTLGIIGKTGSGKSTILNLINRLYDVNFGEILIDNQNS